MAEATPQKRVLPARERAESSAKRRASSPATPATPAPEPRQKRKYTKRASLVKPSTPATGSPTPTSTDEALPTRLQSSKPLPTTLQKPAEKLSQKEYQSIAESAVLAASLYRSRMQWLCEGVFKRYWTKPVKRKGVIEQPPGNPDAKSMSKLGNATMTIEPHVFEVTFYTVKDIRTVTTPYYRHPNQHTVKQQNPPQPAPPTTSVPQTPPTVKPRATPAVSSVTPATPATPNPPPPATAAVAASTSATPKSNPPIKEEEKETPLAQNNSSTTTAATPATPLPPFPVAHAPTQSVAPPSSGSSRPANDPVIQMLAKRAATDNRLKELMKVVAMSQASHEQLKEFQAHIDEFNKIIKEREAHKAEIDNAKAAANPAALPPAISAAAHPATYSTPSRPHPGPPTSIGGPMHMAPPSYATYPQQRTEAFIKHIIIEFHSAPSAGQSASTDRWLFPEYAVLDIKSGGMEMVASFFVVRKGEDILQRQGAAADVEQNLRAKFKPDVEYYQPVTVLIKATQHKTIEAIARAAKPLVECQAYMKEIMDKKTRAPREYLVHQLPRERALDVNASDFVDSAVEISSDEDDELRDVYSI